MNNDKNLEIQLEVKNLIEKEDLKIPNENLGKNAIKISLENIPDECSLV